MNGELAYVRHPKRRIVFWGVFYTTLASLFILVFYFISNRIETHSLPIGQVQLTLPYSKYALGEAVTFKIVNNFNGPIYVTNECPTEPLNIYRFENNQWVRVHDTASVKDCPLEKRVVKIPANGYVNGSFAAWPNLFNKAGKYRIVAVVEHYDALPYQDIEVVPAPPLSPFQTQSSNSAPSSSTQSAQPKPQLISPPTRYLPPNNHNDHIQPNDD